MMSETPKFIALIEQHDCLWRKSFKNNAEYRRLAWDDIGEKMYGNSWRNFSVTERTSAKAELQKKWKNIKDNFIKELRNQQCEKSGISRTKKSKYIFFDNLSFLLPEMDSRCRPSSCTNSFENSLYSNGIDHDQPKDDSNSETTNYDPSETNHFQTTIQPIRPRVQIVRRRAPKDKLTSVQFRTRLLRILATQKNEKPTCQHDEDESFFHSLLPIVRKLDEQQKIQFRMEVLNSLKTTLISTGPANVGGFTPGHQFFPVSHPHQLQVYSLPATHPELQAGQQSVQPSATVVAAATGNAQLEHHVTTLRGPSVSEMSSQKIENVQVYSNVL